MYKDKKISVVIPCYNEEKGIPQVITSLPGFVDEIIVVDNNSTDATAKVARELGAKVIWEGRQGYGRAIKTGFANAKGDIIVTLDGDGTYPSIAIAYLIDILLDDDLDFISTRRMPIDWLKTKENFMRFVGNKIFTLVIIFLYFKKLGDSQSGMWVFKRSILSLIKVNSDGMPFSEELKLEVFTNKEIKAVEVPIYFKYRQRIGQSKLHLWKDGLRNLLFIFEKRFRN